MDELASTNEAPNFAADKNDYGCQYYYFDRRNIKEYQSSVFSQLEVRFVGSILTKS